MEHHEFDIEIRRDGEVKVHIKGVKGKRCLDYVEFLKTAIGPARDVQHTSEFHEPDSRVSPSTEQELRRGGS